MKSVPILPARLDWPSAIGSLLLSFGTLEYFVFVFLKDHLSAIEFEKVKEWHLKDRLTRVAQYLETKCPQAEWDWFAAFLKRVETVRELRNHIAHGQIHFLPCSETGKPRVVLLKAKDADNAGLSGTRELEFLELENALTEMASVNQEFERLAGLKAEEDVK